MAHAGLCEQQAHVYFLTTVSQVCKHFGHGHFHQVDVLFNQAGQAVSAGLVGLGTAENPFDVQTVTPFGHLFTCKVGTLVADQLLRRTEDANPCFHESVREMLCGLAVLQDSS